MSRFDSIPYDNKSKEIYMTIKDAFVELEEYADSVFSNGRGKSEFMTQLEYAFMAAGRAIREAQINRSKELVKS